MSAFERPVEVSALWARAWFNDHILVTGQPNSVGGWIPLSDMLRKLKSSSISHEQYLEDCNSLSD
jgi:hypothetical protein